MLKDLVPVSNKKFFGVALLMLALCLILILALGGEFILTLLKGTKNQAIEPVKESKYINKVSPHRRAIIHKFKYNPAKDTLHFQDSEETYLEIPPLDPGPSQSVNALSFKLEIKNEKGEMKMQGWKNINKSRLKKDSRGDLIISIFTPSNPNESLNIKSKENKDYLQSPLKLMPNKNK